MLRQQRAVHTAINKPTTHRVINAQLSPACRTSALTSWLFCHCSVRVSESSGWRHITRTNLSPIFLVTRETGDESHPHQRLSKKLRDYPIEFAAQRRLWKKTAEVVHFLQVAASLLIRNNWKKMLTLRETHYVDKKKSNILYSVCFVLFYCTPIRGNLHLFKPKVQICISVKLNYGAELNVNLSWSQRSRRTGQLRTGIHPLAPEDGRFK